MPDIPLDLQYGGFYGYVYDRPTDKGTRSRMTAVRTMAYYTHIIDRFFRVSEDYVCDIYMANPQLRSTNMSV